MLYSYAVLSRPDSAHTALSSEKKVPLSHALWSRGYKIYLLVSLLPLFIRTLVVCFTKTALRSLPWFCLLLKHLSTACMVLSFRWRTQSRCSLSTKYDLLSLWASLKLNHKDSHVLRTTKVKEYLVMAVLRNLDHSRIPEKCKIGRAMFAAGPESLVSRQHVCVARLTYKNPWSAFMAFYQIVRSNYKGLQCGLEMESYFKRLGLTDLWL